MKKIKNKQIVINDGKEKSESSLVAEMALSCTKQPTEKGFDVSEMRKRMRVVDVLEKAIEKKEKTINLEDADYDELKKCVDSMRWAIVDKGILEFCDLIEDPN